ncbi:MAG: AzlD domain-containing protein [Actinomycetia bacterium]|nr:AzlD domain-containing protein [Actinomycetes bacterium]
MSPAAFLVALAGLAGGTYLMRILGVKIGAVSPHELSQSPARLWMDRATVVLIVAVAATTMLFEGQEVVGPARIIGAGTGILAALLKAPMLACVVLAMAVCAGLRALGVA